MAIISTEKVVPYCSATFLSSLGSVVFAEEKANVVNPVGKVLFADQPVLSDEEGSYIAIGDQLKLRAGEDGEFETGETSCGVFLGSVGSLNVGRSVTRGYGARPVINVTLD